MTDEQRIEAKLAASNRAAHLMRQAMVQLHHEAGIPWDCVIAGAHAQVITAMTLTFGGPQAALFCTTAAERVRNMPSSKAHSLAFAIPAGSA